MGIYAKVADDGGKWVEIGADGGGGELPGLGGWATITAVSGTYKKHSYGDWVAYEWTDDGTLETQAGGLVDSLMVGPGSYSADLSTGGNGGRVNAGGIALENTPAIIKVYQSERYPNGATLGSVSIGGVGIPPGGSGVLEAFGAGGVPGDIGKGFTSSITGVSYEYAPAGRGATGGPHPVFGSGGSPVAGGLGGPGVVIVRVPKAYADSVVETFHGWDSFALVTDGVVTEVTKVPDNEPRTMDAEWLPCGPEVQVGWLYADGEFVSPGADPDVPEVPEAGAGDFVYEWGSTISTYGEAEQKINKVDKNGKEMPEPSAWDTLRYRTVLSDGSIYDATYPVKKIIDYSAYRRVYNRPNNALTIDPGTEVIITLNQDPAMWSDETLSFVATSDIDVANLGELWSAAEYGLASVRIHPSDLDGQAAMNIAEGKQLVISDSNGGTEQIAITRVELNASKTYVNIDLVSMPPQFPAGTRVSLSVV